MVCRFAVFGCLLFEGCSCSFCLIALWLMVVCLLLDWWCPVDCFFTSACCLLYCYFFVSVVGCIVVVCCLLCVCCLVHVGCVLFFDDVVQIFVVVVFSCLIACWLLFD